ncbi:MAG: 2-phospho-L-lactate transferase [Minwuia sp.]|uniref:2-phospho-L-lactate transferase n=1 Tax=Minwuia sp. TaxID=2493630 RepID=UPI003A85950F
MSTVYLSGGVGGAKLALGLSKVLDPDDLTIIANTGDDFVHLGFPVCPDIDTLVYTLSGLANQAQGWGREDESGHFMETLKTLGGPDWFFLGDRDLAMHAARKSMMDDGLTLTEITARLARAVGVRQMILPMCDEEAPTAINTEDGWLPFQDYFVRYRAAPAVTGLSLLGGVDLALTPEAFGAIATAERIVIGPSNPLISIDPILALDGIEEAIAESGAPVIAVSPIVGGDAIKGPTAKMMRELGVEPSVVAIAERYAGLIGHLVIDEADVSLANEVRRVVGGVSVTATVMKDLDDRIALARHVLAISAG